MLRILYWIMCGNSAKDIGLEVNINKTEYMITNRESESLNGNSNITDDADFEKVSEFKCL